jgi:integrase/recombinase XerD
MSEKYREKLDGEVRRWTQAVEDGLVTEDTHSAVMDFKTHDQARDISLATVESHLFHLRKVAEGMDTPLVDADLTDVLEVLNQFREGHHPEVKDDGIGVTNHQKALRVFYRYREDSDISPDDVEIDDYDGRDLSPDDLLFQEDVDALLKACYDDPRMRAYIAVALATGLRSDALRTLRLRHVEEDGPTMTVRLNSEEAALKGASGSKSLLWAKHYLREWLDVHPYAADDDEDPAVFCSYPNAPHTDDTGDTMHDQTIRDHINRIADRAGLEKNVYPHLFRHTAITRLALEDLNEQQIKQTVDWDGDSSQFSTYVTLADELTNDSIREKLGYPTSPGGTPIIGRPTLDRCDECGDGFPEGAERCPNCEQPLTHRAEEETDPSVPGEGGIPAEDHGRHDAELLADFANNLGTWMQQQMARDDGADPEDIAEGMTSLGPDEIDQLMNADD